MNPNNYLRLEELLREKEFLIAKLQLQIDTRNQIILALGGRIPDDDNMFASSTEENLPPAPPPPIEEPQTDVLDETWYFGSINRVEAEMVLASCNKDSLLIRTSSIPGCFALSKYHYLSGQYAHLLITQVGTGFLIENSSDINIHSSLAELIERSPETQGFIPAGLIYKRIQQQELDKLSDALSAVEEDPEEAKRERLRDKVIEEIIQTERGEFLIFGADFIDYANDLGLLVKHYLVPLSKKDSKICPKEDVQSLFSNISELLDINYSVLNTFEQRKRKKDAGGRYIVGDVFLKMADDFKVYTIYCINHPNAVNTLEKLRKGGEFSNFEKKTNALPETKGIGLSGFLIKPVQRITKYPLLLRELLKYTPETHQEYSGLSSAQDKINQVVDYINERKRMYENEKKLTEIKASLEELGTLELVKPTRSYITEISVKRVVKKNDISDYKLYLFSDIFLFAKLKTKDKYKYKGKIYLDLLRIVDVIDTDETKNALEVMDRNITDDQFKLLVICPSDKEKKFFVNEVRKAQKDYYIENQDKLQAEAKARQYLAEFKFQETDPVKLMKERIEKEKADGKKKLETATPPVKKSNPQEDIKINVFKLPIVERQKSVARYDNYQATAEDLEFSKGDVIWILARHESGIWKGECNGMQGVFPGNSVEIIAERPNPASKPTASTSAMAMRRQPTMQKTQSTGSLNTPSTPMSASPPSTPVSQSLPSKTGTVNVRAVSPTPEQQPQHLLPNPQKNANPPAKTSPVTASPPAKTAPQNLTGSVGKSQPPPNNTLQRNASATLTPVTKPPTVAPVQTVPSRRIYSYEVLRDPSSRPADCEINNLERYLSDSEFAQLFKMGPQDFQGLPVWKRNQLKKQLGLM